MIKTQFLYIINYPKYEESLAKMELKYIFGEEINNKYYFSEFYIPPSRSSCVKGCLPIKYSANKLENIVDQISKDHLSFHKFKVKYIKHEADIITYEERLEAVKTIAYAVDGDVSIHDPEIVLGITHIENQWYFGLYERNNLEWQGREQKPYFYSNALGVRTARALVNIAVSSNEVCRLVDPCCGIGTVVMEALSLNIDIKGYEINPLIGENAKKNLDFFGFKDVITIGNMHDIEEHFDAAVVDLPYGLFNPTTLEEQTAIMRTARRIADRAVIITFEDMDQHIVESGFKIIDRCHVSKGKFVRYISICE